MKKKVLFLIIIGIITGSLLLISCQKGDTGAQGPAGPSGGDGEDSMLMIMFKKGVYPDNNYSWVIDSTIVSGSNTQNYGKCERIYSGYFSLGGDVYRGVIAYENLSGYLPEDIKVEKAYLKLYINNAYSTGITTITAYAVEKNWTEGTGDCSGVNGGGITWDNYDTSNSWDNAGGDFDINTPASDTKIINTTDESVTFELDSNMVENWIKSPSTNYGIVLKDETESGISHYTSFYSSDTQTARVRPELIIYYRIK